MDAKWIGLFACAVIGTGAALGADVAVILDSNDGSSRFGVYDAQTAQLARVASDGVATFSNEVRVVRPVDGASGPRQAVSIGGGEDVQVGEGADGYLMGTGLGAYAVGTVAAFSSPWVAPLVGIAAAALTYVIVTGALGARSAAAPLQDL